MVYDMPHSSIKISSGYPCPSAISFDALYIYVSTFVKNASLAISSISESEGGNVRAFGKLL